MTFISKGTNALRNIIVVLTIILAIVGITLINLIVPTKAEATSYYNDKQTEEYIASMGEIAREIAQEHNIYASVMIAQAILESGSGTSELSKAPNFNQFGIKGVWTDGAGNKHSVTYKTMEDDGTGNRFEITATFRTYNSLYDSIVDYANLLTDTNYVGNAYKCVWKDRAKTYKKACEGLQGNYASATDYTERLIGIIEHYNLTQYDSPNNYNIVGTIYDPGNPSSDFITGMRELTNTDYARVLGVAMNFIGKEYENNSEDVNRPGCAALVHDIYMSSVAIDITDDINSQQYKGTDVSSDSLRMGDLVFYNNNTVCMYIGAGYCIGLNDSGRTKLQYLNTNNITFAKRILKFVDVISATDEQSKIDNHAMDAAKFMIENPFAIKNK